MNKLSMLTLSLILISFSTGCKPKETQINNKVAPEATSLTKQELTPDIKITYIKWYNGNSGLINGKHSFILAKLAAPQIGKVGSVGGSKCSTENQKGLGLIKSFEKMEPEHLAIHKIDGFDNTGRAMVYLRYKNTDVGLIGLRANLLAEWPRRGQEDNAQDDKPDWCGSDTVTLDRNPDYQWYCFTRLNRAYDTERKTGVFIVSDKYCLAYKTIHGEVCLPEDSLTKKQKFKCGLRIPPHDFNQLIDMMDRLGSAQ